MPGSSPTMARREPISRLKSVDLPTLGRPTMARRGGRVVVMSGTRERALIIAEPKSRDVACHVSTVLSTMASPLQPEAVAVPRKLPTLHQFFAPGGMLSQAHPNYEFRR